MWKMKSCERRKWVHFEPLVEDVVAWTLVALSIAGAALLLVNAR